jgi:hypothetical protein
VNPRVKLLASLLFSVASLFLYSEQKAQAGLPDCSICFWELSNCKFQCDEEGASCDGNAQNEYWLCISNGTPEENCQAAYNNAVYVCSSRHQDCYNHCGIRYNLCCHWW